jgi:hypothetical protein
MRFRFWVRTLLPALVLCTIGTPAGWAQGQAAPEDKASESQADSSNSSKEKPKSDSLRDLEDQIFRSFKTPPKGPLTSPGPEPARTPPPTSSQSKRAKELHDRKDWIFMQPEELMAVPTVEELLNLAPLDKKEKSKDKLSPMESYLDRLYHPEGTANRKKEPYGDLVPFGSLNKKNRDKNNEQDPSSTNYGKDDQTEPELPESVRETQHNLKKKLSETEHPGLGVVSPQNRSFFSDIFGLDVKARELPSPAEMEAQKRRMDQLTTLYGFQPAPPSMAEPNNPMAGLVQFGPSVPKAAAHVMPNSGSIVSGNNLLNTTQPGITPLVDPGVLPEVAKFTIQPPAFSPPLPKPEPTRVTPPLPNFNAPRRAF